MAEEDIEEDCGPVCDIPPLEESRLVGIDEFVPQLEEAKKITSAYDELIESLISRNLVIAQDSIERFDKLFTDKIQAGLYQAEKIIQEYDTLVISHITTILNYIYSRMPGWGIDPGSPEDLDKVIFEHPGVVEVTVDRDCNVRVRANTCPPPSTEQFVSDFDYGPRGAAPTSRTYRQPVRPLPPEIPLGTIPPVPQPLVPRAIEKVKEGFEWVSDLLARLDTLIGMGGAALGFFMPPADAGQRAMRERQRMKEGEPDAAWNWKGGK